MSGTRSEFAKREDAEEYAARKGWRCNGNIIGGKYICQFLLGNDVMAYGDSWPEAIAKAER